MKTPYGDTEYKVRVRLKPEKLDYLKSIKENKTIAGKLDEIINFYRQKKIKNGTHEK